MAGTQVLGPAVRETVAPSAVVWIDGGNAVVAATSEDGCISRCEISRGWLPQPTYLAYVVRAIGDRERVVILGPGTIRSALEREYVVTFRRPDRLVDVEPAGPQPPADLMDRLRALAA
jgi:hypothetical protein